MTAAIVLAAGASVRLGEPKQLVRLGEETLLERAVRIAHEAKCMPVVVVLGAAADRVRNACRLGDSVVVVNEAWQEGMGTSIRCGVSAVGNADGCVLMTCDQPAVSAAHLERLIACGQIAASGYAGRRGVPAYFPAESFRELLKLRGDVGAGELLQSALVVELPHGELDVDTASELVRARALFGRRTS